MSDYHFTTFERGRIQELLSLGYSHRSIAQKLQRHRSSMTGRFGVTQAAQPMLENSHSQHMILGASTPNLRENTLPIWLLSLQISSWQLGRLSKSLIW